MGSELVVRRLDGAGDNGGHFQELVEESGAGGGVLFCWNAFGDASSEICQSVQKSAVFQGFIRSV